MKKIICLIPAPLGQVSTLFKVIKNDRTPVLRNLVLLPLVVQQEPDADLQVCIYTVCSKNLLDFILYCYEQDNVCLFSGFI